jgi:hypothetical protein
MPIKRIELQEDELRQASLLVSAELSYDSLLHPSRLEDCLVVAAWIINDNGENSTISYQLLYQTELIWHELYSRVLFEVSYEMMALFLTFVRDDSELHEAINSLSELESQHIKIGIGELSSKVSSLS